MKEWFRAPGTVLGFMRRLTVCPGVSLHPAVDIAGPGEAKMNKSALKIRVTCYTNCPLP